MKYLIFDRIDNRFRTETGWIKSESELFEGEKMLSFNSREEADQLINTGFINCSSYAINDKHPLYKYSSAVKTNHNNKPIF